MHSRFNIAIGGVACLLSLAVGQTHLRSTQKTGKRRTSSAPNGHVMVVIPGGQFMMGSPASEQGRAAEEIQHRVRIPRVYAIATTEVTNEQFARFLVAVAEYGARWKAATAGRFGNPPCIRWMLLENL